MLAIETALLTRRQQSADHNRDKVCQVGVTVNTSSLVAIALGIDNNYILRNRDKKLNFLQSKIHYLTSRLVILCSLRRK